MSLKPKKAQKYLFNFQFHIHTANLETLYKFVPQQCLPKELGGNAGTYSELLGEFYQTVLVLNLALLFFLANQLKDLCDNVDFFEELEKQVVDETKRTEKTDYKENVFGIEGTFKKLNID